MGKPGNTGVRRIVNATRYSAQGFRDAWRHEAAFRQELMLTILMTPVAFWVGRNAMEYLLLIASCLLVIIVELLNSAIEAVVDRFGDERHPLSGRAKDLGSAAVLVSLVLAAATWGTIAYLRFT
jgi:diacylglycerol kinase (ATP)